MADDFVELMWDGGLGVASWRNAVMTAWFGTATAARLYRVLELERVFAKKTPAGFDVISVIVQTPTLSAIPDDAREAATKISSEMGKHTLALAQIVQGGAFWSATVRGVLAGVQLFARAPHPSKTFDTVASASVWMAPFLQPAGGRADELSTAVTRYLESARRRTV